MSEIIGPEPSPKVPPDDDFYAIVSASGLTDPRPSVIASWGSVVLQVHVNADDNVPYLVALALMNEVAGRIESLRRDDVEIIQFPAIWVVRARFGTEVVAASYSPRLSWSAALKAQAAAQIVMTFADNAWGHIIV